MRRLPGILLLAALVPTASMAAGERSYAVMSMVGDQVTVVEHRPTVGSSLSDRSRRSVPFDERVFDRGALLAVEAGIHHADPSAKVVLLAGRDSGALQAEKRALGTPALAQSVADALRPHLPQVGATHLVLLLKSRDPAPLPAAEMKVDAGELEGLGFYADATLVTTRHEQGDYLNGSVPRGYFAPFAYFEVALVDLATGKVLAERPVRAAHPYEATDAGAVNPAQSLSAQEKVRALQALVDDQAEAAATALVAPR